MKNVLRNGMKNGGRNDMKNEGRDGMKNGGRKGMKNGGRNGMIIQIQFRDLLPPVCRETGGKLNHERGEISIQKRDHLCTGMNLLL